MMGRIVVPASFSQKDDTYICEHFKCPFSSDLSQIKFIFLRHKQSQFIFKLIILRYFRAKKCGV